MSDAGIVPGYAGKCVDDYAGLTADDSKVDLSACVGKAPQQITFAADGVLRLNGSCVTGGKYAYLQPHAERQPIDTDRRIDQPAVQRRARRPGRLRLR